MPIVRIDASGNKTGITLTGSKVPLGNTGDFLQETIKRGADRAYQSPVRAEKSFNPQSIQVVNGVPSTSGIQTVGVTATSGVVTPNSNYRSYRGSGIVAVTGGIAELIYQSPYIQSRLREVTDRAADWLREGLGKPPITEQQRQEIWNDVNRQKEREEERVRNDRREVEKLQREGWEVWNRTLDPFKQIFRRDQGGSPPPPIPKDNGGIDAFRANAEGRKSIGWNGNEFRVDIKDPIDTPAQFRIKSIFDVEIWEARPGLFWRLDEYAYNETREFNSVVFYGIPLSFLFFKTNFRQRDDDADPTKTSISTLFDIVVMLVYKVSQNAPEQTIHIQTFGSQYDQRGVSAQAEITYVGSQRIDTGEPGASPTPQPGTRPDWSPEPFPPPIAIVNGGVFGVTGGTFTSPPPVIQPPPVIIPPPVKPERPPIIQPNVKPIVTPPPGMEPAPEPKKVGSPQPSEYPSPSPRPDTGWQPNLKPNNPNEFDFRPGDRRTPISIAKDITTGREVAVGSNRITSDNKVRYPEYKPVEKPTDSEGRVKDKVVEEVEQKQEPIQQPNQVTPNLCQDPCIADIQRNTRGNKNDETVSVSVKVFKACKVEPENENDLAEFEQVSLTVPKSQQQFITQMFNRIFEIESQKCREINVSMPETMALRVPDGRPILKIQYAEVARTGKVGKSRWTVQIPWYSAGKQGVPKVPYQHGDTRVAYIMKDGSRIIVNAKNMTEGKRVIRQFLRGTNQGTTKGGTYSVSNRSKEDLNQDKMKSVKLTPISASFYPNGDGFINGIRTTPEWTVKLKG